MMIDLEAMLAEVRRELTMRARVYPGLVSRGKMTQAEADQRVAVMEAVARHLEDQLRPRFL